MGALIFSRTCLRALRLSGGHGSSNQSIWPASSRLRQRRMAVGTSKRPCASMRMSRSGPAGSRSRAVEESVDGGARRLADQGREFGRFPLAPAGHGTIEVTVPLFAGEAFGDAA